MAKLTRVTGKVFGGSAPLDEIGQFGSALTGNPTNTQDVATIQALDAYSKGWGSAVISSRQFPPIEEVTGALKTISYQGCYLLQEGIPEYDIDTEYSNTSIVKSINNGITTLYVSLANGNKGNALSNATYWKPYVLDQIERNIGEIVPSTIPLTDAGLHLLDGALLQYGSYQAFIDYIASLVTDYPDLFISEADWQTAVTTYGVCGKFVYDSVNNTVRLPKITGILESTTDVTALGDLVEAGLPNITGSVYLDTYAMGNGSKNPVGAFQRGSMVGVYPVRSDTAGGDYYDVNLDASRSSSIYGNSNTVQPQTIKVLYYIVIATSTKTEIEIDIDEIATDLNGKADVDLTNVNNSGTSRGASWAMPSDTYTDLTLGASGTTYTAPANGWFALTKRATGNMQYIKMINTSNGMAIQTDSIVAGQEANFFIPALKYDVIFVEYDFAGTTNLFRFIYAEGSKGEA